MRSAIGRASQLLSLRREEKRGGSDLPPFGEIELPDTTRAAVRVTRAQAEANREKSNNMAETNTPTTPPRVHPLIERAQTSTVPIAALIGFRVEEIRGGGAVASLETGPQHANPMGTLHGGVLCDLADAAMGMAFVSTLSPDDSFTTMALNINFFRPVWQTRLRAEAHVVNRGRSVGYVECDVTDQDAKLVAKATSTCMVLRGDQARAR